MVSPPSTTLRLLEPIHKGVKSLPRHDPPHAATPLDKPLIRNPNFPERLLGSGPLAFGVGLRTDHTGPP